VGSSSGRVKPKTIKLVFVASSLNTQHFYFKLGEADSSVLEGELTQKE
jgi:hypothetical protein